MNATGPREAEGFEWPDLPCAPCYEAYEHHDDELPTVPAAKSGCVQPVSHEETLHRR